MNHARIGAALRALRLHRGQRQVDIARAAGISRETVSMAERGEVGRLTLNKLELLVDRLGADFDGVVRWRGGELDRMLNAQHAALSEQVVAWIASQPGWRAHAEVSFSIGRERGTVDVVAFHEPTGHVVIGELKTGLYDVLENLGTLHRKIRLGEQIAATIGLHASAVSAWLIVSDTRTNRRRLAAHRALVASQLPADGRALRGWFRHPSVPIRGVAFWTDAGVGTVRPKISSVQRVRRGRRTLPEHDPSA